MNERAMELVKRLRDTAKLCNDIGGDSEKICGAYMLEAADHIELTEKVSESRDIVYRRCICEYGTQPQIDMCIEEMSELMKALLKWRRIGVQVSGKAINPVTKPDLTQARDAIVDELADVRIMVRQMEILFQAEYEVDRRIDFKVNRQIGRLEKLKEEADGRTEESISA